MSCKLNKFSRIAATKGRGLLNKVINKLPIELHLPGYQYCGPGTKLQKRLARGDQGINLLDQACKEHDIAYSNYKNLSDRHIADKVLAEKAWQRVTSNDSSILEKANALMVSNMMKGKVKLGMGMKTIRKKPSKVTFTKVVRNVGKLLKIKKPQSTDKAVKIALGAIKKNFKKNKNIKLPRVIALPKYGGALPFLLPLFAGLSALGSLSGGAASISKAFNDVQAARKSLEEQKRHNKQMESVAVGEGLHLKPYRKGLGLYLKPHSKNF